MQETSCCVWECFVTLNSHWGLITTSCGEINRGLADDKVWFHRAGQVNQLRETPTSTRAERWSTRQPSARCSLTLDQKWTATCTRAMRRWEPERGGKEQKVKRAIEKYAKTQKRLRKQMKEGKRLCTGWGILAGEEAENSAITWEIDR